MMKIHNGRRNAKPARPAKRHRRSNAGTKSTRRSEIYDLAKRGGDAYGRISRWHTGGRISQREFESLKRMITGIEREGIEALERSREREGWRDNRRHAKRHVNPRAPSRYVVYRSGQQVQSRHTTLSGAGKAYWRMSSWDRENGDVYDTQADRDVTNEAIAAFRRERSRR